MKNYIPEALCVFVLLLLQQPLTAQNMDTVQFDLPGQFEAPFEYLNTIPASGLDVNGDTQADVFPPCSCRGLGPIQNGNFPDNGYFDDQLIIATGVSGQVWRLSTLQGVLKPGNLQPYPDSTIVPEVGNSGVYVLKFVHRSDVGYLAEAINLTDYPEQVFGPVTKVCHYPYVQIENLETEFCDNADDVVLSAIATSAFDGNVFPLTPVNEFWQIRRLEDNEIFNTQIFSPTDLGEGTYRVSYTFDAGDDAFFAANNTGCEVTVTQDVEVREAYTMACNSSINITLNPNSCFVEVTSALILASNPDPDILFEIDILGPGGISLGSTIDPQYVGETLIATITDECTGLTCTSNIIVNDLSAPTLSIPDDITLKCTEEPETSLTGVATASDCSDLEISYTDVEIDNGCGNPIKKIERTWQAEDIHGNIRTGLQQIFISRADVSDLRFPADKMISCAAYRADSTLADPVFGKGGVPNLVDIPNCGLVYTYTDDTLTICGNPAYTFAIIREWNVLDLCQFSVIEEDGIGNDNVQVIQIRDQVAPQIEPDLPVIFTNISTLDNGLDFCSSTGFIPPPIISDECNDFELRIFTPAGELEYTNGIDGRDGGNIPFPGLEIGEHFITYEAEDACGNDTTVQVLVTVVDDTPPVMICKSNLNITLTSAGEGRLFPEDIDNGSRDDCCEGDMKIKLESDPESSFRNYIDLFCANDTLNVILRVWDCYGNFNDCSATVVVKDAIPPVITSSPADITLTCLDDTSPYLTAAFEAPTFDDNCNFNVQFEVIEDVDDCGIGQITRTWTARDNPQNPPTVFTQSVVLEGYHEYRIQLPSDTIVDCQDTSFQTLPFTFEGCDMIAISATDEVVTAQDDSYCYGIVRDYRMVNWCEYDGDETPFEIPRWDGFDLDTDLGDGFEIHSDGTSLFQVFPSTEIELSSSTGYYQYRQLIQVADDEAPTLLGVGEVTSFCTSDELLPNQDECTAYVAFNFTMGDNCSDSLTILNSLLFNNEDLISDNFGFIQKLNGLTYRVEGFYPVGNHSLIITAVDACGNVSESEIPFEVKDCTLPLVNCPNDTTLFYTSPNGLFISAADLIAGSTDNCGVVLSSFDPEIELPELVYSCDQMGTEMVKIYVSDPAGNEVVCNFSLTLVDGELNACQEFFDLTGHTHTESGFPITQVDIGLEGPISDTLPVDDMGVFNFVETPEGEGYEVTPNKNINHRNGLSVSDLILINRHILNVLKLDSPYRMIAADANRSGDITVLDIIQIRRLILSVDSVYENNTSWRFIPEDYEFQNPNNPFQENFPETFFVEEFMTDTSINFIGLKVGDVDESASTSSLQGVDDRNTVPVVVSLKGQNPDGTSTYTFALDANGMQGAQFTLQYNASMVKVKEIVPGSNMSTKHFYHAEGREAITFCWHQMEAVDHLEFELVVEGQLPNNGLSLFGLSSEYTAAEIILADHSITKPVLTFKEKSSKDIGISNIYNFPNPFISKTQINFYLAKSQDVTIQVFDSNGRLTHQLRENLHFGYQQINLEGRQLNGSGVYYYKIITAEGEYINKLLYTGS